MKTEIPGILHDLRPSGRRDRPARPRGPALLGSDHQRQEGERPPRDHPDRQAAGRARPATRKVFDAVVTRLIAVFYPACIKDVTIVAGESNEVPFRRGVRVIDPGWTVLYPRRADKDKGNNEDEQELPEFRPGESGPHEPFLRAGETTPPKHFTEATCSGPWRRRGSWSPTSSSKRRSRNAAWGRQRRAPPSLRPSSSAATSRGRRRR